MHSEKVPYYILDLLQQVPSVYVRGLGRFDAIFHPAVIDFQESIIKPPFLETAFIAKDENPSDLLASYMHYVSGLDKDEAEKSITDFVETVRVQIDSSESYTINKFGTFVKSSSGILHFTPDWDAFNLSFSGLEAIDLFQHTPIVQTPPISQNVDLPFQPIPAAPVYEPNEESSWVTDRESPEPETAVATIPAFTGPEISDTTSRLWWTILASALLLITILCAFLVWDILSNRGKINQYTAITNDSLSESSPDLIFVDTFEVTEEDITEDTTAQTEILPVPEIIENTETPCFVVVGAFSNADNVVRMEARLKGLNYSTELIKGGSLTKVAIRTSCDQAVLQKTLNDARSTINPEAWIY